MSQLKVYGVPMSRAARTHWMCRELGIPFAVLEGELGKTQWLGGDRFTVSDLNVASVMAWTRMANVDLTDSPRIAEWLDRCTSRPAFGGRASEAGR